MVNIFRTLKNTVSHYLRKVVYYGDSIEEMEKINFLFIMHFLYLWMLQYKDDKELTTAQLNEFKSAMQTYAKYNKVFSLVFEQDIKYYTNVTPTHLQDYWQRIYDKASTTISDNILLDHNGHMLFDENNKIIRYK